MNVRSQQRPRSGADLLLALALAFTALPCFAQTGPLTTQSLFFDQAANSNRGNYVEVNGGLVYNDNVDLVQGGPGDTMALIGLGADTSRDGTRLFYRLDSDLSLIKYLHSEFQTQPYGYLDGSAAFKIVPGLFSWTARETFSQATLTPYQPVTPDNLESINIISTGPRLTLRPTLRTTIIVDGTYSYVDTSSKSPLYVNVDNRNYGADATISRAFTSVASAYITGSTTKYEFTDTTINTDFRQDQGSVGFKLVDARTTLDASVGYTRVHETSLIDVVSIIGVVERPKSEAPSGVNWNVDLSRLIAPTQRLSLHTTQQVTDAANLFRLNVDSAVPTTVPNRITTGQPFTYRTYGATWRLEEARSSLQFDLIDISQKYSATPVDNVDSKLGSAAFARQLGPVLHWDVALTYEHDDYATGALVKTLNAITTLRWTLGQRVNVRFIYAHSTLTPNGYQDNQVGIIASYIVPIPGTAAAAQGAPEGPALLPVSPMSSQRPYGQ
jgi:hypothetical protein